MHDLPRWALRAAAALAALGALLMPSLVHAQGATVYQNGNVVPNHLAKWFTQGRIGDVGGLLGDVNGQGLAPFTVTDGNDLGFCANSAVTTGAYNAFCFGHDASSNALLAVDSYGGLAQKSLKIRINGTTYDFPGPGNGNVLGPTPAAPAGNLAVWNGGQTLKDGGPLYDLVAPIVPDTATLAAASTATYPKGVWRKDAIAGLGAPPLFFTPLVGVCTANGLVNDGGSCVNSAGGNSFKGMFPAGGVGVSQWGPPDRTGAADAHVALQAGLTALGNKHIPLILDGTYRTNVALTDGGATVDVRGPMGSGIYDVVCRSGGIRTGAPNIAVLTLTGAGSSFSGCIDQFAGVVNTSTNSVGVKLGAQANSSTVHRSQINLACVGVEVTGQGTTQIVHGVVKDNVILPPDNTACVGVRVGASSATASTVDTEIIGNAVNCGGRPGASAFVIADSGGMFFAKNAPYACNVGTSIAPGAGQEVDWSFFTDVVGDSSVTYDLLISTYNASARIKGQMFTGAWTSNGQQACVVIAAGPGAIDGIHFTGHRCYMFGTAANGFDIETGQNISIGGNSQVCSIASPKTGIIVGGNTQNIHLQNSRVGNCLPGSAGNLAVAVSIGTTDPLVGTIMGNDFSGATLPLQWGPVAATPTALVGANLGLENTATPVTAAASINVGAVASIGVTGATAITNITPVWSARTLRINALTALSFTGSAGNICNTATIPINATQLVWYDPGTACWRIGGS